MCYRVSSHLSGGSFIRGFTCPGVRVRVRVRSRQVVVRRHRVPYCYGYAAPDKWTPGQVTMNRVIEVETVRHQCRSIRKTLRHWCRTVRTLRHQSDSAEMSWVRSVLTRTLRHQSDSAEMSWVRSVLTPFQTRTLPHAFLLQALNQ